MLGKDHFLIVLVLRETCKYSRKSYLTWINQWEVREQLRGTFAPQSFPAKSLGKKESHTC